MRNSPASVGGGIDLPLYPFGERALFELDDGRMRLTKRTKELYSQSPCVRYFGRMRALQDQPGL